MDILVVEKAHVPYGGQANKGAGNINYLAPGDDHEKWIEHHVKKIGIYLEDQELLRAYPEENVPNLERFDSWGGGICRSADGKIISLKWLPYLPSSMAAADIDMMNPLYRRARKLGVRFINKVAMIDLLKDGDKVVGRDRVQRRRRDLPRRPGEGDHDHDRRAELARTAEIRRPPRRRIGHGLPGRRGDAELPSSARST